MADPKTKPTKQSALAFLKTIEPKWKRDDSHTLLALFEKATGEKAVMWGTSIIGFSVYKIKNGKKENEWPLVAFSPRKQNFTLYIMDGKDSSDKTLFEKLGKHTTSKACLYINALSDVDQTVLTTLIQKSFQHNAKTLA